ncbi:ABC transporter substrate-binding protein [Bacillus solitudinis]|uniref:ABC transporter substrate-binding protein n=1 Tax=Bacillus solitudinis TaxID=2014074 RepID=UPI000C230CBB|nr:ABC transporter substrate-binding protein [Bacillus solitudinis]
MSVYKILAVTLMLVLVLIGCQHEKPSPFVWEDYELGQTIEEVIKPEQNLEKKTLTIWTRENEFQDVIDTFQGKYPEVHVDIVEIDKDEIVEKYLQSIIDKETPDIFVLYNRHLGHFSGIDGLENLSEDPYRTSKVFEKLPEGLLNNYYSFKEENLFAIPTWVFPNVTYYRADILEKEGYPSEPDELAAYMEDADNWMNMQIDLKGKGHFLLEDAQNLLFSLKNTVNYFDKNLNYKLGYGSEYQVVLEVAESVYQNNLHLNKNIWGEQGQDALRSGELAMVHLPSYGEDLLSGWLPEQAGSWRVTTMPFGLKGIDKDTGQALAISSYSKEKELAWAFIEMAVDRLVYQYTWGGDPEFLGGQNSNALYWDLISEKMLGQPTPFDHYADEIWELTIYKIIMGASLNQQRLVEIEERVNERIRLDKRVLLNSYD